MSVKPDNDPYVCFRRREIKTLRKARRGDVMAIDKLRKLREDLTRVKELLDLIHERETCRAQLLEAEREVVEKRVALRRMKKILGVNTPDPDDQAEKPKRKIRRAFTEDGSESTKIRIPMQKLRDAANLVSEIDMTMFAEDLSITEGVSIDEKIKRIKFLDEKSGLLDMTEVHFFNVRNH